MTKKDFKLICSFHEYGSGSNKRNAIYFDYKCTDNVQGYKYMVKASVSNVKKNELFNLFYDWVINKIQLPYYVEYRYALTDKERFKIKLVG